MPDLDDSELARELRQLADSAGNQARPLPPAEVMKRGTRQRWRRMAGQCAAAAVILAAAGGIAANAPASRSPRLVPPAGRPASGSTSTPSPSPRLPSPTPSRHHPEARPRPSDATHGPVPTSVQVTVTPSGFVVAPTPTAQAPRPPALGVWESVPRISAPGKA